MLSHVAVRSKLTLPPHQVGHILLYNFYINPLKFNIWEMKIVFMCCMSSSPVECDQWLFSAHFLPAACRLGSLKVHLFSLNHIHQILHKTAPIPLLLLNRWPQWYSFSYYTFKDNLARFYIKGLLILYSRTLALHDLGTAGRQSTNLF